MSMADDFDYDLDPSDLILNEQRRSHARTLSALDDNPDDAARAEQISRVSGQNPALVHSDLEAKEKQLKSDLTTQLLNNNQYLRSYIDAHPLANKVSNDDYGQLDATSSAMEKLPLYRKAAYNLATGIEHSIGLGAEGLGYLLGIKGTEGAGERYHKKTLSDVSANKTQEKEFEASEKEISGMVFQGVGGLIGLAPSIIAGGLPAAAIQMGLGGGAEARNRAKQLGVDEQTQATAYTAGFAINSILGIAPLHLLTRPAQAAAPGVTAWTTAKLLDAAKFGMVFAGFGELQHGFNEYAAKLLYDPSAAYHPDFNRVVSSFILGGFLGASFNKVAPYVEANTEIPPGAHPLVDHAKAKQAEIDIDNLDNALKEAGKSATRERSPELFKIFMRQHTDAKIGVSAEAILKIYGEKEPLFDDGKLGWVPNIKEQLAVARETGGDVEIPLADWLAHVDPALAKELHDDIRVRTNGLTVREGTALEGAAMVEAYHGTPHQFDAFSMEKIGTGEGAQSYGHGLYFAENKGVAESYKPGAAKYAGWTSTENPPPIPPGNMYRVRIHAEKDQFLDWDRPIGEQSELIRSKFPNSAALTGQQLHEQMSGRTSGGAIDFSNVAKGIGIPGIRYLDQGSRNALDIAATKEDISNLQRGIEVDKQKIEDIKSGKSPIGREAIPDYEQGIRDAEREISTLQSGLKEPTYNYVIFDEKLIEIVDRNGEAIQTVREQAGLEPLARRFWTDAKLDQAAVALEGKVEEHAPGLKAVVPEGELTPAEIKAVEAANTVLDQILSKPVTKVPARLITYEESGIQGFFQQYSDRIPTIMYLMDPRTAVNTVRHEAIHFLRREGFFTKGEWDVLREAALKDGWIEHYDIARRYAKEDIGTLLEEAVAHRYADWADGNKHGTPEVNTIMDRIRGLALKIVEQVKQALPHNMTAEELFQKIESGEIGRRTGTKPLDKRAFKGSAQEMEPAAEAAQRDLFAKANAIGMTVPQFERHMRNIAKLREEDYKAQMDRAEAFERKKQTKEWKESEEKIREEVTNDIQYRPDVAAATFFTEGKLFDTVKNQSPKLDFNSIDPELAKRLPKELLSKTNGIVPDDIAPFFGYQTGKEMVSKLVEMNEARGALPFREFVKGIVDDIVDQRMLKEHGMLEENILKAAQEHVIDSNTQMDILHEEFIGLGMKSKLLDTPFTKEQVQAWVKEQFNALPTENVSKERFLREAGKAGKLAEMKMLIGKWDEAFQAKQQQYIAMLHARETVRFEKEEDRFERTAKRFSAREVSGLPAEYTNFVHDILMRSGRQVRRSVQDLAKEIEMSGYKDLETFVETKQADLREMPVAEFLFDPNYRKPVEQMTVAEFNAMHDSIKTLLKNGRDETKIIKAGDEADLQVIKDKMVSQLETLAEVSRTTEGRPQTRAGKVVFALKTYLAAHIQLESLFNRFDRGDPNGVFTQYVSRELATSANYEAALERKFSRKLKEIKDDADLSERIQNDVFIDPLSKEKDGSGGVPLIFTRKNLRTVLLNVGNASNLDKLARGYGIKPEAILNWVHREATKADWDWAQKIGDVFAEIKTEADVMYRNLSGTAPENIKIDPIDTAHGQYAGWYYPIIFHPTFEGSSKKMMGKVSLEQEGYVRATTPKGYTEQRTGYAAPLALDLDIMASRLKSMIHDIAFRPTVIQVAKIFQDKDVRAAMTKHYGMEYRDLLTPYLQDVANSSNYNSAAQMVGTKFWEYFRQNIIATYIGFNPGTVLKHGPTAALNSLTEVGPINFLREVGNMMLHPTGAGNWEFAMKTSEELQRRHRHYVETFRGAQEDVLRERTLREWVITAGAYPVAFSDLLSAVPTWTAQYKKSMREGQSEGDAVFQADRAVRRAHGSSVITNRPEVMRTGPLGSWLASLYGFFSHILNRQYEMMWHAKDTVGLFKEGEYKAGLAELPKLSAQVFSYVIMPAVIEEMVTPLTNEDRESWGKKVAFGLGRGLSASWIGVRDIGHALFSGHDPSAGLISTGMKTVTDAVRDLKKPQPMSRENAGKTIQHGITLFGALTGLANAQIGKWSRAIYNDTVGQERPQTGFMSQKGVPFQGDYWRQFRHGTMKEPGGRH